MARVGLARSLSDRYSVRLLCRTLGISRSSVLYETSGRPEWSDLESTILFFRSVFPGAGVRYMHELLGRHQVQASRSQVRAVYERKGLLAKPFAARLRCTDSRHAHPRYDDLVKGLAIVRADQVWVTDTTFIRIARRWAYLSLILDAYTRRIVGWSVGHSNSAWLCAEALERALLDGEPGIHHSDQGNTYASKGYIQILERHKIQISMARAASPWDNGYAERLNRTIKDEEVRLSEYRTLQEAQASIADWVELYNHGRIHSSLNYYTPMEFYQMNKEPPNQG